MCVQEKRCFVLCVDVLQSGQRGEGYVVGLILFRYSFKNGEWLLRICANVLRVCLFSFCSVMFTGGGGTRMILLGCLFVRYFCTMFVCEVFMCCLIVSLSGAVCLCGV